MIDSAFYSRDVSPPKSTLTQSQTLEEAVHTIALFLFIVSLLLTLIQPLVIPVDLAIIGYTFLDYNMLIRVVGFTAIISKFIIILFGIIEGIRNILNPGHPLLPPIVGIIIIGIGLIANIWLVEWAILNIIEEEHSWGKVLSNPLFYGTVGFIIVALLFLAMLIIIWIINSNKGGKLVVVMGNSGCSYPYAGDLGIKYVYASEISYYHNYKGYNLITAPK